MPHQDKPLHKTAFDESLLRQLKSLDPPSTEPNWGQFRSHVLARLEQRGSLNQLQQQSRQAGRRPLLWLVLQFIREVFQDIGKVLKFIDHMRYVIAFLILGLLTVITMPRLVGQTDKGRYEQAKIQIQILEDALKRYKLENGHFPTTVQGLQALVQKPSSPPVPRNWPDGGYLDTPELPLDPWGNEFIYVSPGQHSTDYDMISLGADGLAGGSGYDADIESWR